MSLQLIIPVSANAEEAERRIDILARTIEERAVEAMKLYRDEGEEANQSIISLVDDVEDRFEAAGRSLKSHLVDGMGRFGDKGRESVNEVSDSTDDLKEKFSEVFESIENSKDSLATFKEEGIEASEPFGEISESVLRISDSLNIVASEMHDIAPSAQTTALSMRQAADESERFASVRSSIQSSLTQENMTLIGILFTVAKIKAIFGLFNDAVEFAQKPTEKLAQVHESVGAAAKKAADMAGRYSGRFDAARQKAEEFGNAVKGKVQDVFRGTNVSAALDKAGMSLDKVKKKASDMAQKFRESQDALLKNANEVEKKGSLAQRVGLMVAKTGAKISKGIGNKVKNAAISTIQTLWKYRSAVMKIAIGVVALTAAWKAAAWTSRGYIEAVNRKNIQTIYDVSRRDIEALRKPLGAVLSEMQALKEAMEFKRLGFTREQIAKAGELANTIGLLTNQSRKSVLEMIRMGRVSDETLAAVGSSQTELLSVFSKVQTLAGRTISPMERARLALDLLAKRTAKLGPMVKKSFPEDMFVEFRTEVRSAIEEVKRLWAEDAAPFMLFVAKGVIKTLRGVLWLIRKIAAGFKAMLRWAGVHGKVRVEAGKTAKKLGQDVRELQKNTAKFAKQAALAAKAAAEWKQKMEAARKAIKESLDTIRKGYSQVGEANTLVSAQEQSWDNVNKVIIRHSKAMRTVLLLGKDMAIQAAFREKMGWQNLKAILLVGQAFEREAAAAKEVKAKTFEMAMLSRLHLRLTTERMRVVEQEINFNQKQRQLRYEINQLAGRQLAIDLKIMEVRKKASRGSLRRQEEAYAVVKRLQEQRDTLKEIEKEFRKRLGLQRQVHNLSQTLAEAQASFNREQQKLQRTNGLKLLVREGDKLLLKLKESENSMTLFERTNRDAIDAARDNLEKQSAIQLKVAEVALKIRQLGVEAQALPQGARRSELEQRLELLRVEEHALNRQMALYKLLADSARRNFTIFGAMLQQLQSHVDNFNKKVGEQFANVLQGSLQPMFNLISEGVSGAIQQTENLGEKLLANVLSAFGDLSLQLSSFFALEGLGMLFTPGGQGAAVGLFAAAAGLAALGGALKGGSALINANASKSATAATQPIQPKALPSEEKKEQTVVIENHYYNDVPWRGTYSPEQNFRDYNRWKRDMKRSTGRG